MTRRTIASPVTLEGIGLHLGPTVPPHLSSGAERSGIIFRRIDPPGRQPVPARAEQAVLTERHTQLGDGRRALHTVEHVLAAVAGLEIDDSASRWTRPEPPILDGSARPFHDALASAGIAEWTGEVRVSRLRAARHRAATASRRTRCSRRTSLSLEVTIDFPHPLIGRQRVRLPVTPETLRARAGGGADIRVPSRGRGAAREGADPGRLDRERGGARRRRGRWTRRCVGRTSSCVTRRWTASAIWRSRASGCGRGSSRIKPSHRGTVHARARDAEAVPHEETRMLGDRRDHEGAAAPISVSARGSDPRDRAGEAHRGDQERHDQRAVLPGAFPGASDHAGRADRRGMAQVGGMLLMGAVDDPENEGRVLHVARQREVAEAGEAGRPAAVRARHGPDPRRVCKMRGIARVDGEMVCEADMAAMVARSMSARIHPTAHRVAGRADRRRTSRSARSRSSARSA